MAMQNDHVREFSTIFLSRLRSAAERWKGGQAEVGNALVSTRCVTLSTLYDSDAICWCNALW